MSVLHTRARLHSVNMSEERNQGAERQDPAVESALANIDIVSHLALFLEANDLCRVKATCKSLGSPAPANDESALNGLSMADEAARRIHESASDGEKALVRQRYDGESWMKRHRLLLMSRSKVSALRKYLSESTKACIPFCKSCESHTSPEQRRTNMVKICQGCQGVRSIRLRLEHLTSPRGEKARQDKATCSCMDMQESLLSPLLIVGALPLFCQTLRRREYYSSRQRARRLCAKTHRR